MADWTINAGSNPSHYLSGAGCPMIRYYQESTCASSAVIKLGDIVSFDTVTSSNNGRIVRAPFDGGTTGAASEKNLLNTTNVLGIAVEASTSDGSTTGLSNVNTRKIGVAIAEAEAEFQGFILSGGISATTLVGLAKAVRYDSTNHIYGIDSTNSTAALASIVITGVVPGAEGDTGGPVMFKFLSTGVSPAVRAL